MNIPSSPGNHAIHPKCPSCGQLLDELGRITLNAPDAARPDNAIRVAALACPHCHSVIGLVPDVSTVMDAASNREDT